MTRRDFACASAAALIIAGAICTPVAANDVKRVSANGTELSYVEAGQGEPVIFVHGGFRTIGCGPGICQNSPAVFAPSRTAAAIIFPTM
jgi:hypothetical protein